MANRCVGDAASAFAGCGHSSGVGLGSLGRVGPGNFTPSLSSGIAWAALALVVCWFMAFYEQLARILAAVVLIVAFAAPSLAFAHAGHQPLGAAAKFVPVSAQAQAVKKAAVAAANVAVLNAARASVPVAAGVLDCGGHCCGGAAGMACCGAALAPDPCPIPLFTASLLFLIRDVPPPRGISPEALPKPPKPFA